MPDHRADRAQWDLKNGGWEKERLDSMGENIGKGDVVYYCGAELGEMPALCALWGADVVLFEPNHSSWPSIKMVWEANKLKKPLGCFAGFVSNVNQPTPSNPDLALKAEVFKGHGWKNDIDGWPIFSQQPLILDHGFSELHLEANGLPQYRIDDLAEYAEPTILIIDVEGSEFEVLKGAARTLEVCKPKIWLSLHPEMLFGHWGEYARTVRDFIINKGYKEHFLAYEHEVHFYYEPIKGSNE